MIFYVIELQSGETGSCISVAYTDRADAEQKYHEVLMYACKSNIRKHGAILVNEDGFIIKSEIYNHEEQPDV